MPKDGRTCRLRCSGEYLARCGLSALGAVLARSTTNFHEFSRRVDVTILSQTPLVAPDGFFPLSARWLQGSRPNSAQGGP
jgi:hypothetical protein